MSRYLGVVIIVNIMAVMTRIVGMVIKMVMAIGKL